MLLRARAALPALLVAPALLASVLVVGPLAAPSGAAAEVTLAPAVEDNAAVRQFQDVEVGGKVPAEGELDARLVAVTVDPQGVVGERVVVDYDEGTLGQPADRPQHLRRDGTALTGRLNLPCEFGSVSDGCPPSGLRVTGVRVDVVVGAATLPSTVVPVDPDRPFITGYRLVAPSRLEVRFNEPVRGSDSAADWTVSDPASVVHAVSPGTRDCGYLGATDPRAGRDGCTRLLDLLVPLGEDDTPRVVYDPEVGRPLYKDDAGNTASRDSRTTATSSEAADAIRPARPSITSVAGQSGASAVTNDPTPEVRLGDLATGQEVSVQARRTGTDEVRSTAWVPTSGSTAVLELPPLADAGEEAGWTLVAVARDAAGNLSSDPSAAGRPDGRPEQVALVVDTLAPVLRAALGQSDGSVAVQLSEAVTGTDDPAHWTVTPPAGLPYRPSSVTGSGAERRLVLPTAAPAGSTVAYQPASGRYQDRAANPVADQSLALSAVLPPVVRVPAGPLFTSSSATTVSGDAADGTVELRRGSATGEVLATTPASGGRFSTPVPLAADGTYDLVAVLVDPSGARSTAVAVPRVVRDTVLPRVDVTRPAEDAVLAGGSRGEVAFALEEAHPATERLELSLDGGRTWTLVAEDVAGSPVPVVLPDLDAATALYRVRATDRAGNAAQDDSGAFRIDATPPAFSARTLSASTVEVLLSEPVTGSSSALDWRVRGERASRVEQSTRDGRPVLLLTTAPGVALGPDELPPVSYAPSLASSQYRDAAGQPVEVRDVVAADGILPAAPAVTAPAAPVLTGEDAVTVAGRAQPGATVELLREGGSRVAGPLPVAEDGTWRVQVRLAQDATTRLTASARDTNGNASATATRVPDVEQDGTAPVVTLSSPTAGSRLEPGTRATATWRSTDRNPAERGALVELSTDGGRTWRAVATDQPGSGSAAFDVPDVRTGSAALRVSVPDRLGARGTAVAAPLGIGQPAGPVSSTPPALPPVGTLTPATGRLLDTREGVGAPRAAVGPGGTLRLQVAGRLGVPASGAEAVALVLTAVQAGAKTHVSVVPSGSDTESTASLTAAKGETVANHVTVRLGSDGAVVLRNNSGRVHLLVDLLGWYAGDSGTVGAPFTPLPPQRLLDTREGVGAPRGQTDGTVALQVTGRGGVPSSGVTAVVLSVAAVGPSRDTHVTAWPGGSARPETSMLNVPARGTRASLVTVPVGPGGVVSLAGAGARVHLVADVFGWYGPSGATVLEPVEPARVLDTRTGPRQPATSQRELVLRLAGRGGLPATGVRAVVLQLTAVAPSDSTHVTAWAGGAGRPGTANLNATRGTTVSTQVVVPVGPDGTVRIGVGKGRVHLVADVAGWFRSR